MPPRDPLFCDRGGWAAHRWLLYLGFGKPAAGRSSGQYRQEAAALPNRTCCSHGSLGGRSGIQGTKGLGDALLADALDRAIRSEIAAFALKVDAKDKAAATFYLHHGFTALPDLPRILFLPLTTVQSLKNKS